MNSHSPEERESLWRRKLSAAEREALRATPELELEARLTEALARLPDSPLPSNFTARVLTAIELEDSRSARAATRGRWSWNWQALLPRFAVAGAVILLAGYGLQMHERERQRADLARSLSLVAAAPAAPSVEALENLDAIQRMGQPARADTELLAALQ